MTRSQSEKLGRLERAAGVRRRARGGDLGILTRWSGGGGSGDACFGLRCVIGGGGEGGQGRGEADCYVVSAACCRVSCAALSTWYNACGLAGENEREIVYVQLSAM